MIGDRTLYFLIALLSLSALAACSSVKETSSEENKPLWTNEISLETANEFVSQLDIASNNHSKPVFLVGKIDTAGVDPEVGTGLEYDIELALVNTGRVSFIKDKKARDTERESRKSLSDFENADKISDYFNNLKVFTHLLFLIRP